MAAAVIAFGVAGFVKTEMAFAASDSAVLLTTQAEVSVSDDSENLPKPEDYLKYKLNKKGHAVITGLKEGYSSIADIVIPGSIDGYKVTAIGKKAFKNKSVKSVTIEKGQEEN